MESELLLEGLDGAQISNETLDFLLDIIRQSGNPEIDKNF